MEAVLLETPREVSEGHFFLKIETGWKDVFPGQFVNVRIGSGSDPLLRRPFSVFNHRDGVTELLVRVVGKGTKLLSRAEPGPLDVIGPLGRGFTLQSGRALLVGGGVGNAPLFYLARGLRDLGCEVHYIYGARAAGYVYMIEEYRDICENLTLVTDDGSAGEQGLAVDYMDRVSGIDRIYTCGPTAMMAGVAGKAGFIPVEISVENYFGCGIGICSGCTIETSDGLKRACVDGPVFDGGKVLWDRCRI